MHRSIIAGIFIFTLSTGVYGIAAADQTTPANDVTPVVAGKTGSAVSSATPAATETSAVAAPAGATPATAAPTVATSAATLPGATAADSGEPALPTAGADLAMWNATPVAASDDSVPRVKPLSRLRRFASGIMSRSSALVSSLTRSAMRFIGVPYVFGGTRTSGFDCSGYVQHVFGLNGVHLPRTADAQYDAGRTVGAAIVPGDLVFFHTYAPGVSHVGIYLGNSKFIHASSSRGVAVSSLHSRYWAPRYVGAKRVVGT